jgi:hypothetical protein
MEEMKVGNGSLVRPLVRVSDLLSGDVLSQRAGVGVLVRMETMVDSVLENLQDDVDVAGLERAGAVLAGALAALESHLSDSATAELRTLLGPLTHDSPALLRLSYAQFSGWLGGALIQERSHDQIAFLGDIVTRAFGPQ